MGPPPAPLPDELIEEILLRIPPSDPATRARAAIAQKRWCGLVAGDGFRRRYRARHRAPPMLGFFCNSRVWDRLSTSFVPTSSFRPKPDGGAEYRELRAEDARHGRVLLRVSPVMFGIVRREFGLVVWHPASAHPVVLPRPRAFCDKWKWKATVLCAAPAGSCDHLDCHHVHFTVVLIGDYPRGLLSCVYSSQAGAWSKITFDQDLGDAGYLGGDSDNCSALVGNAVYRMLYGNMRNKILKYDLGTLEFSVMEPPPLLSRWQYAESEQIQLTTMEDGQLGLAVLRESTLYILSTDEEFGWGGTKIIDLEKCGNYVPSTTRPFFIGFAGDIGLAFMNAGNDEILSVDIRSAQVKVVCKTARIYCIVPYINFCTPAMGVPSRDDKPSFVEKDVKPRAGASRDVHSFLASILLRRAVDTGGQSQPPVDNHRASAVRQPQPHQLCFLPPRRLLGHSPPPQGPCFPRVISVLVHVFLFVNVILSIVKFDASVVHFIASCSVVEHVECERLMLYV